jgi:hypothetical protein
MKAISVYNFVRHFQIARSSTNRTDRFLMNSIAYDVAEKTGSIKDCVAINERRYDVSEAYIRASPPPSLDFGGLIMSQGVFLGVESNHLQLQPRHNVKQLLEYAGMANIQDAENCWRSSAEWGPCRALAKPSSDGITHMFPDHAMIGRIRAMLSFAVGADKIDTTWLNDLPPADTPTLHCVSWAAASATSARVLVAEVFEQQDCHSEAIRFASCAPHFAWPISSSAI